MSARLALFLLAVFFTISALSIRHSTETADERWHYQYGVNVLAGDSTRFDDSKMPFSALNAVPAKLAEGLGDGALKTALESLNAARWMTILFAVLTGGLVYRLAAELYGPRGGLLALFLFAFDPNLIAYGSLVTTDMYISGMALAAMYTFWKFLNAPSWKTGVLAALALGLAQLAKYTGIFLYPICLLVWLAHSPPKSLKGAAKAGLVMAGFAAASILIINLGFLWNRVGVPLAEYPFRSEIFQGAQTALEGQAAWRVPLAFPYLEGLDWVVENERHSVTFGRIYLFGQLRESGFMGYYLYAALVKVPLATLVIIGYAFWRRKFVKPEIFLLIPVLFFTVYFNFFYNAQIGFRYYLVIFPLLYVFCGRAVRMNRRALTGLAVWLALSVLSYFPHYIPYYNEIVLDRRDGYKFLADSNSDWGQAKWYLAEWLDAHPEAVYEPETIAPGTLVVSVNHLTGVTGIPERWAWLREGFEPDGTIAYSYLIYHLSPERCEARGKCVAPETAP